MNDLLKLPLLLIVLMTLVACENETPVNQTVDEDTPLENHAESHTDSQEPAKYSVLETPLTVSTGDKIEVSELFWYGCGHCYALEPYIETWLANKPSQAEFVKVPAIFSQNWAFHGQAYYTMEVLGVLDSANERYFKKIHVDREPVSDLSGLITFLADFNKTESDVTQAFNSTEVESKLRNAGAITRASTARGVPTLIVDGKYLTSASMAGGQTELFELVNELVDKAAAER